MFLKQLDSVGGTDWLPEAPVPGANIMFTDELDKLILAHIRVYLFESDQGPDQIGCNPLIDRDTEESLLTLKGFEA